MWDPRLPASLRLNESMAVAAVPLNCTFLIPPEGLEGNGPFATDALLFHAPGLPESRLASLRRRMRPHQSFVAETMESYIDALPPSYLSLFDIEASFRVSQAAVVLPYLRGDHVDKWRSHEPNPFESKVNAAVFIQSN